MTAPARITESFVVRELPGLSRGGRQLVKLSEPLEYRVGSDDSAEVIVVPCGFVTDFASVPWGVRDLFPAQGLWGRPAIIHDFLYRVQGKANDALSYMQDMTARDPHPLAIDEIRAYLAILDARPEVNALTYTRAQADAVFAEAMQVVGVPAWRRTVMYRAVRGFGAGGWGT